MPGTQITFPLGLLDLISKHLQIVCVRVNVQHPPVKCIPVVEANHCNREPTIAKYRLHLDKSADGIFWRTCRFTTTVLVESDWRYCQITWQIAPPVSYTHLDVYKRQVVVHMGALCDQVSSKVRWIAAASPPSMARPSTSHKASQPKSQLLRATMTPTMAAAIGSSIRYPSRLPTMPMPPPPATTPHRSTHTKH